MKAFNGIRIETKSWQVKCHTCGKVWSCGYSRENAYLSARGHRDKCGHDVEVIHQADLKTEFVEV